MKSTRNSTFLPSLRAAAVTGALLFLACAVAPPPAHAQSGNTKTGVQALDSNTTGDFDTANGFAALTSNTSGSNNTAVGAYALRDNTSGIFNTATGRNALRANIDGFSNTATGVNALLFNTTGSSNTATGLEALYNNQIGELNTATGVGALFGNTQGTLNTATGASALRVNQTGSRNTAIGAGALRENTADFNTATGAGALALNTVGIQNSAHGYDALVNNTGNANTATGVAALFENTTGNNNIALGKDAGRNLTTGNNNIAIGAPGTAGESNTIRIGKQETQKKTFIQGIFGATVPNGVQVVANSGGKLGTIVSSARFKDAVKPMDKSSEALFALQPVTFRYRHELDPEGIAQFGLVAEEVEKVNPDLVMRDAEGKVNTVRYEAVNAMLLNEFLKQHREVQKGKAAAAEQRLQFEAALAGQQKQIKSLAATVRQQTLAIEKMSAQLALTQSSAHVGCRTVPRPGQR